jgi:hypothetical protein
MQFARRMGRPGPLFATALVADRQTMPFDSELETEGEVAFIRWQMAITHTSRSGKIYYLHAGPKRGGALQYFFSTQSTGSLAECLPDGFEVYESVRGVKDIRGRGFAII